MQGGTDLYCFIGNNVSMKAESPSLLELRIVCDYDKDHDGNGGSAPQAALLHSARLKNRTPGTRA